MLRLNLLRELQTGEPGTPTPPPYFGLLRRLGAALLGLLVAGALLVFVAQPDWLHGPGSPFSSLYELFPAKRKEAAARLEAARQDSLRRVEAVGNEASLRVNTTQILAEAWLEQLETILPSNSGNGNADAVGTGKTTATAHTFSLASFTPPGTFLLKGTAASGEALSTLQETLVLFPGMDLSQSEQEPEAKAKAGIPFVFSGTVQLDTGDSLPVTNRVLNDGQLDAELEEMIRSALSAGITLTPPQTGRVSRSGSLRLHPYRLAGTCDSTGFSAVAVWLAAERARASAFGIQRLALSQRGPQKLVFLDIMAFSR